MIPIMLFPTYQFLCIAGFQIIFTVYVTEISANLFLPISDIECPPFNITDIPESRLSHGYKIGTQANFTCPRGFELIGKPKLTCLSNGMYAIVYLYYLLRRYYILLQTMINNNKRFILRKMVSWSSPLQSDQMRSIRNSRCTFTCSSS